MATYKDIKRQIAELEKKAAEIRKVEVSKVIAGIKVQIAEYNLNSDDLFKATLPSAKKIPLARGPVKTATKAAKPASVAKYMDPKTGKTWTGHGKTPNWLTAAVKKGNKEDFLITKVEAVQAVKTLAKKPTIVKAKIAKLPPPVKPVAKPATTVKTVTPVVKKTAVITKKMAVKPKVQTSKKPAVVQKATSVVAPVLSAPASEIVAAPITGDIV